MLTAKESNTRLMDIYEWPVVMFFYTASYIIEQNEMKIRELEKVRAKR